MRDFLSSICIQCQKQIFEKSVEEREKIMILAFINGLQNTAFAKILTELKPKTVDEAYTLIKHEKTDENQEISYVNALINSQKQNTCNCSIQMYEI